MGELVPFPRSGEAVGGTIHVYARDVGGYEVAHESRSGSSWGNFEAFDCAEAAVAAGYALNRSFGGDCEVFISPQVLADLPRPPAPARGEL